MAYIKNYRVLRHLRSAPTTYVQHVRRGRVKHDGTGQAFWFRPLAAVLSEVPVDDRELPLVFHARTSDFQDVSVQATVTYRITGPPTAAQRIDFSIDTETGLWRSHPLEQLGGLLTESAQAHALDLLARTPLAGALADGIAAVRRRIGDGLAADSRLAETGVAVLDVRVVAIRPQPDVEKALQTPMRESVQQDADRATYERRALAVERERAISENELQNKIELARREEELVAQHGTNARREAETAAEADRITVEAEAGRERALAEAKAEGARLIGEANAAGEAARVNAYRDLDAATLLALAANNLAGNLPQIDNLVLSPDLLTTALTRLTGGRS